MKAVSFANFRMAATQTVAAALLIATVTVPGSVRAAPVLDQSFDASGGSFLSGITSSQELAQTFTVGLTGLLTSVDVQIRNFGASLPLLLDIRSTSGGAPVEPNAPVLASASLPPASIPGTVGFVSFGFTPFAVTAGDVLAIALRASPGQGGFAYGWQGDAAGGYGPGQRYLRTPGTVTWFGGGSLSDQDFGFKTFVDTAAVAVPEPTSLALFATGLLALALMLRRRRKAA